jgi:hypothetical protein
MNSRIFGIESIVGRSMFKCRLRLGRRVARLAMIAGILVAAPTGARAGTLVAPILYPDSNSYIACTATNGGTSPAKVAITGLDAWGGQLKAYGQPCSDLAPGVSCTTSFAFNQDASCNFQVSGKIRAVAMIYDSSVGRTLVAIPATK